MIISARYLHTSAQQIEMGNQPVGYLFPITRATKVSVFIEEDVEGGNDLD